MDEAVGTRITNVIITKHELTKEQSTEITELLSKVANDFASKVDKQNEEQLYYVKSPLNDGNVLNADEVDSIFSFDGTFQISGYQTRFNQTMLDRIQNQLPLLNIEDLKVRVEDFGNGQDN